eukprot:7189691-Ditylum_brightwellii.AAC.1
MKICLDERCKGGVQALRNQIGRGMRTSSVFGTVCMRQETLTRMEVRVSMFCHEPRGKDQALFSVACQTIHYCLIETSKIQAA